MKKTMKRLVLTLLVLVCICTGCATFAACGKSKEIAETEGLAYEKIESLDQYAVVGIGEATATEIRIPSSHEGKAVMRIAEGAFKDCDALTKIVVPNSVKIIDPAVFEGCTSLRELTVPFVGERKNSTGSLGYFFGGNELIDPDCIPATLKKVTITEQNIFSSSVFINCKNLQEVVLRPDITKIADNMFYACESLTKFTIPKTVERIGHSAFSGCKSLKRVVLPDSLTYIDKYAFSHCVGLTDITIPKNVKYIAEYAFKDCTSLKRVTFANPNGWKIEKGIHSEVLQRADISNKQTATKFLTDDYSDCFWYRK